MQASHLPIELHEQIIDHLWDDLAALFACSLTCRSWIPASRVHIFRELTLSGPRDCIRLERLLTISNVGSRPVGRNFRELRIRAPGSMGETIVAGAVNWMDVWLPRLLTELSGIRRLLLYNVVWTSERLQEATMSSVLTFSANVQTLELQYLQFDRVDELYALLQAYPRLTTLHLMDIIQPTSWHSHIRGDLEEFVSILEPHSTQRICIHDLTVRNWYRSATVSSPVSRLLLLPPFELYLRKILWSGIRLLADVTPLQYLATRAGSNLEDLQFTLEECFPSSHSAKEWQEIATALGHLSLATNDNLRSFRVVNIHSRGEWYTDHYYAWIPPLLSTIHSTRLKEVKLTLGCWVPTIFDYHTLFVNDILDKALATLGHSAPNLVVQLTFQIFTDIAAFDDFEHAVIPKMISRFPNSLSSPLCLAVCCAGIGRNQVYWLPSNWKS